MLEGAGISFDTFPVLQTPLSRYEWGSTKSPTLPIDDKQARSF